MKEKPKTPHECQCEVCGRTFPVEQIGTRIRQIEADERYRADPADFTINGPLALQQVALKIERDALRWVLDMWIKECREDHRLEAKMEGMSIKQKVHHSLLTLGAILVTHHEIGGTVGSLRFPDGRYESYGHCPEFMKTVNDLLESKLLVEIPFVKASSCDQAWLGTQAWKMPSLDDARKGGSDGNDD